MLETVYVERKHVRAHLRDDTPQKMHEDLFVSGDKTVLRDCQKGREDRHRR